MRVVVTTAIPVNGVELGNGFVTWYEVHVETDAVPPRILGSATVARIRVEDAVALGLPLTELLEATGGIEDLLGLYLDNDGLRPKYAQRTDNDVLYIGDLVVTAGPARREVESTVLRHIYDTLGSGCRLAVLPYESRAQAQRWAKLGFSTATPERPRGHLHLVLGEGFPPADDRALRSSMTAPRRNVANPSLN